MTIPSDHREIEELLGAYAVHALDDDEQTKVERHLRTCSICRQEVDGYFEIAAALAAGEALDPPPEGLWDRIANRLPSEPAALRRPGRRPAADMRLRRRASPRRLIAVGAAAAAVAAICVLAVDLATADQQLSQARQALGSSVAAFHHALTVPGRRTAALRTPSGEAIAEIVVDPGGRGYLLSTRMPVLENGHTFQLWAVVNGKPISIGLFGNHMKAVAFALGSAPVSALAVTVEPAGGVQTPTYPIIATATV
jgi:anti-sigma-K factor RskA